MKRRAFLGSAAGASLALNTAKTRAAKLSNSMSVALLGDCLLARRVSPIQHPDFLDLVKLLRETDCTWANGEILFIEPGRHSPGHKGMDPHASAPPWGADELKWMGIDFVGLANNHILDFCETGMFENLANLSKAGIAFAGVGADLDQASRPGYVDVSSGRVAQVSFATTFHNWFAAAPTNANAKGRPGLNPLHLDSGIVAPKETFEKIQAMGKEIIQQLGLGFFMALMMGDEKKKKENGAQVEVPAKAAEELPKRPKRVPFGDFWVEEGDAVDFRENPRESDVERIEAAIKVARGSAKVVLATIHSHESRNSQEEPARFMQRIGQRCIDSGADAYVGTGPHRLRGIEIYKNRPIFYSLGNFIFQYESMSSIPAESFQALGLDPQSKDTNAFYDKIPYQGVQAYWESVVPVMHIDGKKLNKLELHPIVMGFGLPRYERGTPMLARGEDAERIIAELARLSEPYGTKINVRDGIGEVVLPV